LCEKQSLIPFLRLNQRKYFPRLTGKIPAETGSLVTASTASNRAFFKRLPIATPVKIHEADLVGRRWKMPPWIEKPRCAMIRAWI
jgi:hypothetical protein